MERTLWNFKSSIDAGGTAIRRNAYDSVEVFAASNCYYIQYANGVVDPFTTFSGVVSELRDWALYEDWQLAKAVR